MTSGDALPQPLWQISGENPAPPDPDFGSTGKATLPKPSSFPPDLDGPP
ncbi:hypothetical protein TIFTF001_016321 [Ficus carica]|uniref:Uncharacterized protein n=1 Tax=Ficus carica TaxID=3494 RepID=A0AA88A044_FICCA|nr:hypothetical protein TIFTF001_016321 [Ficus carica]